MQPSGDSHSIPYDDPVLRALVGKQDGSIEELQSLIDAIEKAADAAGFLEEPVLNQPDSDSEKPLQGKSNTHYQAQADRRRYELQQNDRELYEPVQPEGLRDEREQEERKHQEAVPPENNEPQLQVESDANLNRLATDDHHSVLNKSTLTNLSSLIPTRYRANPAGLEQPESPAFRRPHGDQLGEYILLEKIGQGGFSRIYKGYHRDHPNSFFAIKVYENAWIDSIGRLEIESFVLRKLQHPNLVRAVDIGCDQGVHFLVLSLIEGTSLDRYLEATKLEFDELAKLFLTIAQALAYAHEHEVVHRDLKPNNIMITTEGQPIVTDFGLAKRLDFSQIKQSMTVTGALIGTLGYLAPEQASGNKHEVTRATDIYGLGATLYFALTGQPPLARDNLLQAITELNQKQPDPPRSFNPDIPLDLQLICLKCLEKLPHDRYESMQELADEFQRFIDRQPILARPVKWTAQFQRWCRANPLVAALSLGLLASILVGLLVSLWLWNQANLRWQQSQGLLTQANSILRYGDSSAEQMLKSTAGSLKYRYERLKQSIQFREELAALLPADDQDLRDLGVARFMLGKVCMHRGFFEEGHENYLIAQQLIDQALVRNPTEQSLRFGEFHVLLGLDHSTGQIDLREEYELVYLKEAQAIIEDLIEDYPDNVDYQDALACTLSMAGGRLVPIDPDLGLGYRLQAHRIACALKSQLPEPCLHWRHVGGTALGLSWHYLLHGKLEEAEGWSQKAYEATLEFLERPDLDPLEYLDLAECLRLKFRIEQAKGNFEEADKWKLEWSNKMTAWSRQYPDYFAFANSLDQEEELYIPQPKLPGGERGSAPEAAAANHPSSDSESTESSR